VGGSSANRSVIAAIPIKKHYQLLIRITRLTADDPDGGFVL
jgi:hypothetical protein